MKVKFYLKKKQVDNKDGTRPIRIYVRFHGQTHRINLGRTIHPDHWDKAAGAAREGKKYPLGSLINQLLDKARNDLRAAELKLDILGIPLTFENLLQQCWPDKVKKKEQITEPTIEDIINKISSISSGRKESTMLKYSKVKFALNKFRAGLKVADVKNYGKVVGLPANMQESNGGIFAEYFVKWMQEEQYADSSVKNYLSVMREIYGEIGLKKDTKYLDYQSRVSEKESLDAAEFRKLIAAKIEDEVYERHRDVFVLQAFLGLRDSDLKRLNEVLFNDFDIKGYGQVKVMQGLYMRKTTLPVLIPIHPKALELLEKYDFKIPTWSAAVRIDGIREVFKRVGLTRKIVETSFVANNIKTKQTTLDQVATTHTARRTCGQLLRKQTGQKDVAAYVLGHKEQGSTSIYTTEDPERVIPIILKAWDAILNPVESTDNEVKQEK